MNEGRSSLRLAQYAQHRLNIREPRVLDIMESKVYSVLMAWGSLKELRRLSKYNSAYHRTLLPNLDIEDPLHNHQNALS